MEIDWFGVFANLKALRDTLSESHHAYNKVWCGLVTGVKESQKTLVGIEVCDQHGVPCLFPIWL
jgi:hypothetical protein